MPTKVIRLDEDAIAISLKYGKTPSEGIRSMEAKLLEIDQSAKPIDMKALEKMIRSCVRDELEVLSRGY
ncbi:hypothetical protein McpSp1_13170 [Methanocorpusculaceae archaeon Sp1]|nr:hypothetical protein [Methanocorpusculaceae archaeon Sp1]